MEKSAQIDDATAPASKPTTSKMITDALTNLDEKNGATFQAIKKFIVGKFNVDIDRYGLLIKKALLKGLKDGILKKKKADHKGVTGKLTF